MQPDNVRLENRNFLRIDAMWAWISSDDEGEGIVGVGMLPLIGADRERVESYRKHAEGIAKLSGRTVRLVRFTTREDLETLEP